MVERYDLMQYRDGAEFITMSDGEWVKASDYDALAARLAEAERDAALGRIAIKFVD